MTRRMRMAALFAAQLACMGAISAPAHAMQILEAADHAELAAEVSARDVSRIALVRDRIAKVVRSPDGFAVEHDPRSGDLYLRPVPPEPEGVAPPDRGEPAPAPGSRPGQAFEPGGQADADPVTLFIGTERGFTYRLTLTRADRGSAQILIRNPDASYAAVSAGKGHAGDPRIAALVRLVRAVARREPLPGYSIDPGNGRSVGGLPLVETWRGPRLAAHVIEAGRDAPDAADLAGTVSAGAGGVRVAAVWIARPDTGPSGGRLAVAVTEPAAGHAHSGDVR